MTRNNLKIPPHNINDNQWKKKDDNPGLEPETCLLVDWLYLLS